MSNKSQQATLTKAVICRILSTTLNVGLLTAFIANLKKSKYLASVFNTLAKCHSPELELISGIVCKNFYDSQKLKQWFSIPIPHVNALAKNRVNSRWNPTRQ